MGQSVFSFSVHLTLLLPPPEGIAIRRVCWFVNILRTAALAVRRPGAGVRVSDQHLSGVAGAWRRFAPYERFSSCFSLTVSQYRPQLSLTGGEPKHRCVTTENTLIHAKLTRCPQWN